MIKKIFEKFNKTNTSKASFQQVGTCPKCGNRILEYGDVWSCEGILSKSCNLSIPRTIDGKEITMEMINFYYYLHENSSVEKFIKSAFEGDSVLQEKTTNVQSTQPVSTSNNIENQNVANSNTQTNNTVNKNSTSTKVANTNSKTTVNTNNNSKESKREIFFKNGRKLVNKCSCGGEVYRYGNFAACKQCDFKITTKYAEKNFSDNEMSQLIGKRISYFTTFKAKCSNGAPLKGRVFINFDINGNLIPEYKFVNSPVNINGHYKEQLFAPDKDGRTEIPLAELFIGKNSQSSTTKKENTANNNNNNNNIIINNPSGDGTHIKFNPFEGANNGGSASKVDEYTQYLSINDSSEPF